MKVTDSRIQDATQIWFDLYEAKLGRKPMWGAMQAGQLQRLIKSFDQRKIAFDDFVECMKAFMKSEEPFVSDNAHSFSIFCKNPDKYLPKTKGEAMVEKITQSFAVDAPVQTFAMDALVLQMSKLYAPTEDGCAKWAHAHRFMKTSLVLEAGALVENIWRRAGQAAKLYFGEEMVKKVWKQTSVNPSQERIKKQAKEILTQENK